MIVDYIIIFLSNHLFLEVHINFSHGSVGKESACNAGDTGDVGSIPGSGRSPEEGNGNLLQYSCLENPMDCIVHGILQARILEWVGSLSSRGSSQPRDQTCISCISCIAGRLFTH